MTKRTMKLGLNIVGNGAHAAGWRMPEADPDALDIDKWVRIAQAAERACMHFMFWADGIAVRASANDADELSYVGRVDVWEPLTVIAALSMVTKRLGFVASASTTYNEPYHVARKFASLDRISRGRVGWNIVTSWSEQEALNFGRDRHMEHGLRYRRAEEFVDVVMGLWDEWQDDAFIRDKASGRYFDPARLHVLGHVGESFRVRGPLNISRPPQGYPVLAQAGSSGPGQGLGSRVADLIYTAQGSKAAALSFYASVKAHAVAAGRDPDGMLVMPGVLPVLGATRAEAQARFDAMQELVSEGLGLPMLRTAFGDLSAYDLDGPMPADAMDRNGVKSTSEALLRLAQEKGLSIRGLYKVMAGASGHNIVVGTVADVADQMQDWFEGGACDGWNLMPPYLPEPCFTMLETLVPELQRRGVFQTSYSGVTFRESMGLGRPERGSRVGGRGEAATGRAAE